MKNGQYEEDMKSKGNCKKERQLRYRKSVTLKECNMKKVQYGKSSTRRKCNIKRWQQKKRATRDICTLEKAKHGKSVTWKSATWK